MYRLYAKFKRNYTFLANVYIFSLAFTLCGCNIKSTHRLSKVQLPLNNQNIRDFQGNCIAHKPKRPEYKVSNKTEFLKAIKKAKKGESIYILENSIIDLTGTEKIIIPAGVTIFSIRNTTKNGALIFTNEIDTYPLFLTSGENIRFSGIRIQGPDSLRRTKELSILLKISRKDFYSIPNSRGIQVIHSNTIIENCEIYGWSHAAIFVKGNIDNVFIRNNFIHHNQRYSLGYGICIDVSNVIIDSNFFDWNRHSIAGTGNIGTSYEASYNIIGENANSHAFDMHGGKDRKDGTNIAGKKMKIHHNIFYIKNHDAIRIRGTPTEPAEIYNNEFRNLKRDRAIKQDYAREKNIDVYQNIYQSDLGPEHQIEY